MSSLWCLRYGVADTTPLRRPVLRQLVPVVGSLAREDYTPLMGKIWVHTEGSEVVTSCITPVPEREHPAEESSGLPLPTGPRRQDGLRTRGCPVLGSSGEGPLPNEPPNLVPSRDHHLLLDLKPRHWVGDDSRFVRCGSRSICWVVGLSTCK